MCTLQINDILVSFYFSYTFSSMLRPLFLLCTQLYPTVPYFSTFYSAIPNYIQGCTDVVYKFIMQYTCTDSSIRTRVQFIKQYMCTDSSNRTRVQFIKQCKFINPYICTIHQTVHLYNSLNSTYIQIHQTVHMYNSLNRTCVHFHQTVQRFSFPGFILVPLNKRY